MMIKLVVGTEAMFFLALIMAYVYISFPPASRRIRPINWTSGSTGVFSAVIVRQQLDHLVGGDKF